MTRSIVRNWALWYVDEHDKKVTCRNLWQLIHKKKVKMLSHFGYANRNGKENIGVELNKI
jgi:hypothetical protein